MSVLVLQHQVLLLLLRCTRAHLLADASGPDAGAADMRHHVRPGDILLLCVLLCLRQTLLHQLVVLSDTLHGHLLCLCLHLRVHLRVGIHYPASEITAMLQRQRTLRESAQML